MSSSAFTPLPFATIPYPKNRSPSVSCTACSILEVMKHIPSPATPSFHRQLPPPPPLHLQLLDRIRSKMKYDFPLEKLGPVTLERLPAIVQLVVDTLPLGKEHRSLALELIRALYENSSTTQAEDRCQRLALDVFLPVLYDDKTRLKNI